MRRRPQQRTTVAHRALRFVEQRTGYNRTHLSLGLQLAVAYAIVMVLLVIDAAYHAVNERSTWTVFIVLAVSEPIAGGWLLGGWVAGCWVGGWVSGWVRMQLQSGKGWGAQPVGCCTVLAVQS